MRASLRKQDCHGVQKLFKGPSAPAALVCDEMYLVCDFEQSRARVAIKLGLCVSMFTPKMHPAQPAQH